MSEHRIEAQTAMARWRALEEIILSGQMPEDRLHALLEADGAFAAWIAARAAERQESTGGL